MAKPAFSFSWWAAKSAMLAEATIQCFSILEIHFLLFMNEFREGTYPGLFPVYRG
jgi:hypothetical protein